MANLQNCIITTHISQEFEGDYANFESYDQSNEEAVQTSWNEINPDKYFYNEGGIAGMYPQVVNPIVIQDGASVTGMNTYGSGYGNQNSRSPGGASSIILTISPNNSEENLQGKDYQYVVSAFDFVPKGTGFSTSKGDGYLYNISNSPYPKPDYLAYPYLDDNGNVSDDNAYIPVNEYIIYNYSELSSYIDLVINDGEYSTPLVESDVRAITLHDTGIPNTPGNKVIVKVYLKADFVMPANDVTINISLTMDAVPYRVPQGKLTWLLTNQIWPNYNSWKLLTGNNIQDTFRYQYWDEANVNYVDNLVSSYSQAIGFEGSTFYTNFQQISQYYEDIGYWPQGFTQNSLNSWRSEEIEYPGYADPINPTEEELLALNEYSQQVSVAISLKWPLHEPTLKNKHNYIKNYPNYNSFYEGTGNENAADDVVAMLGDSIKNADDGGWTIEGYNNWLVHEFINKQNPRVIANCTTTQVNSNITTDQDTNTWVSDIEQTQTMSDINVANDIVEFKITPDDGYTISAFDVCILPKNQLELQQDGSYVAKRISGTIATNNGYAENIYAGHVDIQYNENIPYENIIYEDEGANNVVTTDRFSRLYINKNLSQHYAELVNNANEIAAGNTSFSMPDIPFINVKYEDGSTLPYAQTDSEGQIDLGGYGSTNLASFSSTVEKALPRVIFGSGVSTSTVFNDVDFIVEAANAYFTQGINTLIDFSQFETNSFFNKKFESWTFGYPLVFKPFKRVHLGRRYTEDVFYKTAGVIGQPGTPIEENIITPEHGINFKPQHYGLGDNPGGGVQAAIDYQVVTDQNLSITENMFGSANGYPGGAASFASYDENSGVEYVEIKNSIPHSFQENPSPDNEVHVRIKIKSDWIPETDKAQTFMLQIWGQARSTSDDLEFNDPNVGSSY